MKVLLYSELQKAIEKSGVGRALRHQQKALQTAGVEYTLNPKENYNIIHINTVFARSFFLAKKARRQGKKVVYHAHSTGEDFRNSFVGSNAVAPLFTWWIKQCYQTGDLILTPTPYSKSLLEQYGIKSRLFLFPTELISIFLIEMKRKAEPFVSNLDFLLKTRS